MATTVGKALQKVKLAKPLNERVWLWVRDHKEKTSKEISLALNEAQGNVSSVLGDMVLRKMMTVTKKPGVHNGSPVGHYSTNQRMKTYKLLPKVKPTAAAAVVELPAATPASGPVAVSSKPSLDTLSVKEAFELYKELHVMFGPKAT